MHDLTLTATHILTHTKKSLLQPIKIMMCMENGEIVLQATMRARKKKSSNRKTTKSYAFGRKQLYDMYVQNAITTNNNYKKTNKQISLNSDYARIHCVHINLRCKLYMCNVQNIHYIIF